MSSTTRRMLATLAGVLVIIISFVAAGSASAAPDPATYGPGGSLQVGSTTVTRGGSVPVSGKNCTPNSAVTLSLGSGGQLGTAPTNGSGGYSTTVTIPSGTPSGSNSIVASGADCASVADIAVVAPSSSGSGGLADTGVAVIGIGALGVVLLVGGGLMLLAGRRRKAV